MVGSAVGSELLQAFGVLVGEIHEGSQQSDVENEAHNVIAKNLRQQMLAETMEQLAHQTVGAIGQAQCQPPDEDSAGHRAGEKSFAQVFAQKYFGGVGQRPDENRSQSARRFSVELPEFFVKSIAEGDFIAAIVLSAVIVVKFVAKEASCSTVLFKDRIFERSVLVVCEFMRHPQNDEPPPTVVWTAPFCLHP